MLSLVLALLFSPAPDRQAQASLEARVHANASDPHAHLDLCRTYYGLENWDAAIRDCETAVKLDPSGTNHDWLGRAYGAKAEHSSWLQAISLAKKVHAEFESAVAAAPQNAVARRDLAEFYVEAPAFLGGGKDKALNQAQALQAISKPASLYVRARLAESDKNMDEAERYYRDAVTAANQSGEFLSELAGFYRRAGKLDQMQQTIAQLQNSTGEPVFDGASMLVRTGRQLPTAIAMLKRYIAQGATADAPVYQAYYQLGLAYEKLGDKNQAKAQFQQSAQIADYSPAERALAKMQ